LIEVPLYLSLKHVKDSNTPKHRSRRMTKTKHMTRPRDLIKTHAHAEIDIGSAIVHMFVQVSDRKDGNGMMRYGNAWRSYSRINQVSKQQWTVPQKLIRRNQSSQAKVTQRMTHNQDLRIGTGMRTKELGHDDDLSQPYTFGIRQSQ
jgi:hypothetical protein